MKLLEILTVAIYLISAETQSSIQFQSNCLEILTVAIQKIPMKTQQIILLILLMFEEIPLNRRIKWVSSLGVREKE